MCQYCDRLYDNDPDVAELPDVCNEAIQRRCDPAIWDPMYVIALQEELLRRSMLFSPEERVLTWQSVDEAIDNYKETLRDPEYLSNEERYELDQNMIVLEGVQTRFAEEA